MINNDEKKIEEILSVIQSNGKLTVDEQIKYMKYKGIKFDNIKEDQAKEYLINNTYYYKLTAFRKNISKKNNKYINLDFGLLKDLATLDMYLRYISIKLTLDIEHSLKTLLINTITDTKSEDGYSIVDEYDMYCRERIIEHNPKFNLKYYKNIDYKIMSVHRRADGYHYDLYKKRKKNPPIWVLIELMSFGELIRFIEFYYENNKASKNNFKEAYDLLKYTKNFRDSAAHSRPLLLNITLKSQLKPSQEVTEYARNASVSKIERKYILSNIKIHDFACILILHDRYISSKEMKNDRKGELEKLKLRCLKRNELYNEQVGLKRVYEVYCKLLDNYNIT